MGGPALGPSRLVLGKCSADAGDGKIEDWKLAHQPYCGGGAGVASAAASSGAAAVKKGSSRRASSADESSALLPNSTSVEIASMSASKDSNLA